MNNLSGGAFLPSFRCDIFELDSFISPKDFRIRASRASMYWLKITTLKVVPKVNFGPALLGVGLNLHLINIVLIYFGATKKR